MVYADTVRLIGFTIGTILHITLLFTILQTKRSGIREWPILLAILSLGMWHMGHAISSLYWLLGGSEFSPIITLCKMISLIGLGLLPSFLLHAHLTFSSARRLSRGNWPNLVLFVNYIPALFLPGALSKLMASSLEPTLEELSPYATPFMIWFAIGLVASSLIDFNISTNATDLTERKFFRRVGFLLLAIATSMAYFYFFEGTFPTPRPVYLETWRMLASNLPTAFIAYSIYRFNFLELIINRRFIYVLSLSIIITIYLFFIRRLSDYLAWKYEAFADLAELLLIFALVTAAIPIYLWINRFITKRIQLYSDFTRSLNEQASSILNLKPRLDFLVAKVAQTFHLNKVSIVFIDSDPSAGQIAVGPFGSSIDRDRLDEGGVHTLASYCLEKRMDILRLNDSIPSEIHTALKSLGSTHLFPLWHGAQLVGLMLIDTYPRKYLDEHEGPLLAICSPIAASIENGKMIEEKIKLERAFIVHENMANLGKVATQIAHEIKNPLSSIKTIVQLMREQNTLDEEYKKDLSFIDSEINRLDNSVVQLLNFSRPVQKQQGRVDLTELLQSTVAFFDRRSHENKVKIECQVDAGLVLSESSPESVKEIILNLLINALQASPKAGKVQLKAYASDESVVLEIIDDGPGIPKDLHTKVFEPFFTTKQKGTGLGLAIVKKNLDYLGGRIILESPIENNSGTKFKVVFPLAKS